MKKLLFLALFVVAVLAPCQVIADELGDAGARAEQARQKAGDFEGSAYFPSDWEAAEALYAGANDPAAYNTAADAFDNILRLTIPLYAQAREDEIMALRDALVVMGAKNIVREYFASADQTALAALDQYEAEDYYTARDTAAHALTMYQVLTSACNAWLVREEITERAFEGYDEDNFAKADEIIGSAMDAFEEENYPTAIEKAEEALLRYDLVLSTAWTAYTELRSSLADAERQAALLVKANISSRDIFYEAETNYKIAEEFYKIKEYEEASMQFINSETLFIMANTTATEKRRNALDAIKEAYEKIGESEEIAKQADITLKGGAE